MWRIAKQGHKVFNLETLTLAQGMLGINTVRVVAVEIRVMCLALGTSRKEGTCAVTAWWSVMVPLGSSCCWGQSFIVLVDGITMFSFALLEELAKAAKHE